MFLDFDQELELDEGIRGEHIQKGEEEEVKEQGCWKRRTGDAEVEGEKETPEEPEEHEIHAGKKEASSSSFIF
jgi:hypothetical protein